LSRRVELGVTFASSFQSCVRLYTGIAGIARSPHGQDLDDITNLHFSFAESRWIQQNFFARKRLIVNPKRTLVPCPAC
jgi:hypothetical protein